MRVLICEDNALIAMSLEDLVEHLGHDTAGTVSSAEEALRAARTARPDLALLDLRLADGVTGPELVGAFAEQGIGCIVISGQVEEVSDRDGIFEIFRKPVNEQRLADAIRRYAERRDGDA